MKSNYRWTSLITTLLILSLGACSSKGSGNRDIASIDEGHDEESLEQMMGDEGVEVPARSYRKPSNISARGGMGLLQTRCGVYAAADETSQKFSSLKEGRELWIKPAAEGWVEVQRKTGPAYMKADCF